MLCRSTLHSNGQQSHPTVQADLLPHPLVDVPPILPVEAGQHHLPAPRLPAVQRQVARTAPVQVREPSVGPGFNIRGKEETNRVTLARPLTTHVVAGSLRAQPGPAVSAGDRRRAASPGSPSRLGI